MSDKKNGFTLIELLVIIAIIGVLATIMISSLNEAKLKAKDAAFKTTAKGIQSAVAVCCQQSTNGGGIEDTLEQDVCNPGIGSSYPTSDSISEVEIVNNCDSEGDFEIHLKPGIENNSGKIDHAACTKASCQFL